MQADEGLQDAPAEGGGGVLDAAAQAESALELGLLQQQLAVGAELRRPGQQGRHAVDKLWNQTGVGVVGLAEVVGYHLTGGEGRGGEEKGSEGEEEEEESGEEEEEKGRGV